ncbi:MAG: hypothetical protein Q8L54_12135 [Devosia sp.]|nr:hypothetical protein [Devosia sp.]
MFPSGLTAAALAEKVAFLRSPAAYPHGPKQVETRETHMSWVFLTGSLAYKLKKAARYPFLDFSTLDARQRHCATELRLNRRLAGDIYRRLIALRRNHDGQLNLDGKGEIVDWLIEMEQLPAGDMLDTRIREGRVGTDQAVAVAEKLGRFYAAARPQVRDGAAYLAHLVQESAINRKLLTCGRFGLHTDQAEAVVERAEDLLRRWSPAISERVRSGKIVEGHGDLRPEHVSLRNPVTIIDCLEFDRNMRLLDPYDEINYLGLECELLGAGWIRPLMLGVVEDILGGRPEPRLLCTYGAFRAVLRARICIAHLLDPQPSEPERWPGEAHAYLTLAEEECIKAEG